MLNATKTISGLLGVAVGDALGVPVEFTRRSDRQKDPVTSMRGYGTHNQKPGTWSDDSSLTFCLAECLCNGFSLEQIATAFSRWYRQGYWTAHGDVFDSGLTTRLAITKFETGTLPIQAGGNSEDSNGNGSLMRILPMAYCYQKLTFSELITRTHQVSCLTHAHLRSQMACGIYVSIALGLLAGEDLPTAYLRGLEKIQPFYTSGEYLPEMRHFARVFSGNIAQLPIAEINSGGYVVETLEAALWCLFNSSSYPEAVLTAVNLGGDTDTTAAVTGGLAGIYYGVEAIPIEWREQIARQAEIIDLAERFTTALNS